jgi:hypothetical protein
MTGNRLGILLAMIVPAAAVAQDATLDCQVASPRYRGSLYSTMMTLEGAFRVTLALGDGLDAVTLAGTVTEPGGAEGDAKVLPGAMDGTYHLPFILRQYEPGPLVLRARALDGDRVMATASATVNVMPRAPHEVTLSDAGALLVQGVPVFPIGYAGAVPQRVGALPDASFGLLLAEDEMGLSPQRTWDPRVLAVVAAPQDGERLAANAASGAIGAWLATDERDYASLMQADPYHPVIARSYEDETEGDVVLMELDAEDPASSIADLARAMGEDALGRPHWALLPSPQAATGERLAALAVGCAVAGGRGVVFRSGGLTPPGLTEALDGAPHRLSALAPLLLAPYAPRASTVDEDGVIAAIKRLDFDDYLIIANLTDAETTVTCRGLGPEDAVDLMTGQAVASAEGGVLRVPMAPWATRALILKERDEVPNG